MQKFLFWKINEIYSNIVIQLKLVIPSYIEFR